HQPVTRAEIEDLRGVSQSKGTLDVLMEAGWVKPGRRRRTPGRPLTWVTTPTFLDHFGLERTQELPGIDELKAAGFLDGRPAIQGYRSAVADPLGDGAEEGEGADHDLDADDSENEFTRPDPLAD
ncbi:MAG: SMC-Scp complex subunit ScpB, partial [Pseudomonadota bacterium]